MVLSLTAIIAFITDFYFFVFLIEVEKCSNISCVIIKIILFHSEESYSAVSTAKCTRNQSKQ